MIFEYYGKDNSGVDKKGQIEAQNEKEAINKLHEQGLIVISIDNIKTKKCPFCAEEIQKEAIKCKHCGEVLDKRDYQRETNKPPHRKNGCGCLLSLVILYIAYVIISNTLFKGLSFTTTSTTSKYYQIGELVTLKEGYPMATTKELFDKAINVMVAKDSLAFLQLISTGLVNMTKAGEEAYYEGSGGLGIAKIRLKGSATTYYTNIEAVRR